ncbi:MAG TPA: hypothetical protein VH228_01080 [Nocardioides sp.]|jgi:hypothetical protein|nr:hypothetical protein [Nocardioides sp.]
MSPTDDGSHTEDEKFKLRVDIPRNIRGDRNLIHDWLVDMAVDLMNSDYIHIDEDEDQSDSGGDSWVNVTMNVRPCGGRFPMDDDDDQGGDDGPGGDDSDEAQN